MEYRQLDGQFSVPTLLSSTVPLSDGAANTAPGNRAGAVGVAVEAARADHVHPIERLNVVVPVSAVTFGGRWTLVGAVTVTDQSTTEETVSATLFAQLQTVGPGLWATTTINNLTGMRLIRSQVEVYSPSAAPVLAVANNRGLFNWSVPAQWYGEVVAATPQTIYATVQASWDLL